MGARNTARTYAVRKRTLPETATQETGSDMMKSLLLFFALATLSIAMLSACADNSRETVAQKHAAQQHAAMAKANHRRRLAWQKAHPREWAAAKAAARADAARRVAAREAQKAAARAEAARRVAAREAQRREQAAKAAAASAYASTHTPCKEFGRSLDAIHAGNIVSGYDCSTVGGDGYLIHVTMLDDAWSTADYDERLRLAKGLWEMCVRVAHPGMADSCHVKLVGQGGEDLGGSNDFAGSMIDVSKN